MNVIFKIDDKFDQLMLYKYFLNDIKNIERTLKERKKYKDVYHQKLTKISNFISPNYKEYDLQTNFTILDDLEMIESFLDDETLYNEHIEKIRISLKGFKETGTFLDFIIKDIDEAITYYGFFGENILDDKFNSTFSQSFINKEKILELSKKYSKTVKIIINFFETYQKIKNIPTKVIGLVNDIKTVLPNDEVIEDIEICED